MVTSGLDHKRRDVWTAPPLAQRYISRSKMRKPVLGLRVLQTAINDLEGACQRQAQPAYHLRQSALGFFAVGEVQRRLQGKLIEDRP
jgi:hypothetical protein